MTHIRTRTDTAAGWTSADTVLQDGEEGHEKNTHKSKHGDGVTPWTGLPYDVAVVTVTKADVGLGSAEDTSDADKPISSATQAALNLKAPTISPAFTGTPTTPTPATSDNDTSIASTAFVQAAIAAAIAAAGPSAAITAAIDAAKLAENPVGHIRFSANNVNPGTYISGSTWVAWGSGRVPVGVDTAQSEFNVAEETGGAKTVTLVAANLPPHDHQPDDAGDNFLVSDPGGTSNKADGTGWHGTGQGSTGPGPGTSSPVNKLPPYITCYMWKRTA